MFLLLSFITYTATWIAINHTSARKLSSSTKTAFCCLSFLLVDLVLFIVYEDSIWLFMPSEEMEADRFVKPTIELIVVSFVFAVGFLIRDFKRMKGDGGKDGRHE